MCWWRPPSCKELLDGWPPERRSPLLLLFSRRAASPSCLPPTSGIADARSSLHPIHLDGSSRLVLGSWRCWPPRWSASPSCRCGPPSPSLNTSHLAHHGGGLSATSALTCSRPPPACWVSAPRPWWRHFSQSRQSTQPPLFLNWNEVFEFEFWIFLNFFWIEFLFQPAGHQKLKKNNSF